MNSIITNNTYILSKKITIGIYAHVDAGKNTFVSALHEKFAASVSRNALFLDAHEIEASRGITIFSKIARLEAYDYKINIIDTPGHIDFSDYAEETLAAIDVAIIIVSATAGVQSHTRDLLELMEINHIPCFVFINKLDIFQADYGKLLSDVKSACQVAACDFSEIVIDDTLCVKDNIISDEDMEAIAMSSDELIAKYLDEGMLDEKSIAKAVFDCKVIPVVSGSAAKNNNVDKMIKLVLAFADRIRKEGGLQIPSSRSEIDTESELGAICYKVDYADDGERLSFLKVVSGEIRPRDMVLYADNSIESEKINVIRQYDGDKFETLEDASVGDVVAVTGLRNTYPLICIGNAVCNVKTFTRPALCYDIIAEETSTTVLLDSLKKLSDKFRYLDPTIRDGSSSVTVHLLGEISADLLLQTLKSSFGISAAISDPTIEFLETIAEDVETSYVLNYPGHYAMVTMSITKSENTDVTIQSEVESQGASDSFINAITSAVNETDIIGINFGYKLSNVRFTIKDIDYDKHSSSKDFRDATRQVITSLLVRAKAALLEPYYDVSFHIPADATGRVISDITQMGGTHSEPIFEEDGVRLRANAPVRYIINYAKSLSGFTSGKGSMSMRLSGYKSCTDEELMDSLRICDFDDAYLDYEEEYSESERSEPRAKKDKGVKTLDEELDEIFLRAHGPIKRVPVGSSVITSSRNREENIKRAREEYKSTHRVSKSSKPVKRYLLVDGYNVIYSWDDLRDVAGASFDGARMALLDIMSNYAGHTGLEVIVVFDAYNVSGGRENVEKYNNITVVYTREAETADGYIMRATKELSPDASVTVATSDAIEQLIILSSGAYRMSSRDLRTEVEQHKLDDAYHS